MGRTFRTRMMFAALSFLGTATLPGCASKLLHPHQSAYETVQADPRHDTELARNQYEKARKSLKTDICGVPGNLAKAEDLLQKSLAADVRFGPAHNCLGIVYYWQHRLYLAAWEFEYASRLMPDSYEPLNNLGLVYEAAGKYERAVAFYLLARERAPESPQVIGNLARASLRSGQTVDDIRPILEDVVATDSRPEWVRWAEELLGVHPLPILDSWELPEAPESLPEPGPETQPPFNLSESEEPLVLPRLEITDLPNGPSLHPE